jgi:hypothetical protein
MRECVHVFFAMLEAGEILFDYEREPRLAGIDLALDPDLLSACPLARG